ncbi:MAG: acyltransferase [Candidatus Cryptobacteroides sp.]
MERQWDGRTRGGRTGYAIFIKILKALGLGPAYALLCLVVPYFVIAAPSQTKSAWTYASRILGMGRFRSFLFLFSSYFAFGKSLIDRFAIQTGMQEDFSYEFENHEAILSPVRAGKGVVMIGAHIGSWQMGFPFADRYGAKVNIVMFDNEWDAVKDVMERNSQKDDVAVIPVREGDISGIFLIREALSRGEAVCFQGDRYMEGNRVSNADFMGRKALFPSGPFILAAKLRVPVVFYFAMREKGRKYRFIFREAVNTGDMGALLESYVRTLEEVVRKYPAQWFNYYDFWNIG